MKTYAPEEYFASGREAKVSSVMLSAQVLCPLTVPIPASYVTVNLSGTSVTVISKFRMASATKDTEALLNLNCRW